MDKYEGRFRVGNALLDVDLGRSVEDPAQAEDAQSRKKHVDGDVGHGQQEQILEYILGTFRYFLWRFLSVLYVFMNFSESVWPLYFFRSNQSGVK